MQNKWYFQIIFILKYLKNQKNNKNIYNHACF